MPLEKGGRADKLGNRYEINFIIYELLNVLNERNYSVVIEALGTDEIGTDILVTSIDGIKEHQQCKARNRSKEKWDISDLKALDIFKAWNVHLNNGSERSVSLVSPLSFTFLTDLTNRARNTNFNTADFYNIQILKSDKKFQKFYIDFCKEMNLTPENNQDILKSINYLRKISYKQMSEFTLKEFIKQHISFLFITPYNVVYNALISFVISEDIFAKEITYSILLEYLKRQNIELRLKDGDERIGPIVERLNQEYRAYFRFLHGGLIYREEFDDCIKAIENEKSIIISGGAGYGKSGCTEAILNYCEENKLPHIAIKLDQRIPFKNCEVWGKDLGFQGSIVYSLHNISRNENAVIILDQLDALRWTQSNSSEAVSVCMELIKQVQYLNRERKKKIIIIFVCRSYDLENDNNINLLFKNNETSDNCWEIVKINEFKESEMEQIIGEGYNKLSLKLKKILKIPSNLYIWEHLDKKEVYTDCLTTSHLIDRWFKQISKRAVSVGIQEKNVRESVRNLVDILDKNSRLYIPRSILNVEETIIDYLVSSEFITVHNNKIGFVHQSILDYFISHEMLEKYFDNQTLENIIGDKHKQTPGRRYQVQMFLQNLFEYDSGDFISFGEKMIISQNVRSYVKYIFYEILGQIDYLDDNLTRFIVDNCEGQTFSTYLLNNVIYSRKVYINALRDNGIIERWYLSKNKKIVFSLLASVSSKLNSKDVAFIRNKSFINEEDDREFMRCFNHYITEESDEMFELRMMYYKHYPEFSKKIYLNIDSILNICGRRSIQIISFWMKNNIIDKSNKPYCYEKKLIDSNTSFIRENAAFILDELLIYLPKDNSSKIKYSTWSNYTDRYECIERVCVDLVKKATNVLCKESPNLFWQYYEEYMGFGYPVFNEIILEGFINLSIHYSNRIIKYLISDIENNMFDYTSGAEDMLGLVKDVLKKHAIHCNEKIFTMLEKSIYEYNSSRAVEWYKRRIDYNKDSEESPVYFSFWGDFQFELLPYLPQDRISRKTKELSQVLNRRFPKGKLRYSNANGSSGWVRSPISGKDIGIKQWLQIITNKNLKKRNRAKWIENDGVLIESSYEIYANDFNSYVSIHPQETIHLVLDNKEKVLPIFVDSLFSGLEMSEKLKDVDPKIIEKLFLEFPCEMTGYRAMNFCNIIEKLSYANWSSDVKNQLKKIALFHYDSELNNEDLNLETYDDCTSETLYSRALNCVRGNALRAIGNLLWENDNLLLEFKDVIERKIADENKAVRMATLHALIPSYNIDRDWASKKIIDLFESDIRTVNFYNSKDILCRLYPEYKKRVIHVIKECFKSNDEFLNKNAGYALCEFYILYDEFKKIILSVDSLNELQIRSILEMAIVYLKIAKYKDKAKDLILNFKDIDFNIEYPLTKMFYENYVDAIDDKLFILELMQSKMNRSIVGAFVHFLEENAVSLVEYADIVLNLCENVLKMPKEELEKYFGLEDDISKLLISLYDETVHLNQERYIQISNQCLNLWDIMFERQLGSVREISRKLMDR